MRRLAAALWFVFACAMIPAPAAAAASAADNPTIVIGVIATLSGPGAQIGQDTLDGISIAVRQLGGRFANQEVRVVAVDDQGTPDHARQSVQRLLERERVDFVITAVSSPSMAAISRLLLAERLIVINVDGIPPPLAGAECSPNLFDLSLPPEALHEAAGAVFSAERFRRVVVIGPDLPSTDQAVASIGRVWHGEIVTVIRPRHGAATYPEEVATIRRLAPDAVYTLLTGGMGLAFVRDYSAAGLKADIPLIGQSQAFERPMLPAMDENGLDGLSLSPWSPDLDQPANRRLISDFEAEFSRPATPWAALGYDAALLLDSAMRATNGRTHDHDAVRNALRRADFPATRGIIRFDTNQTSAFQILLRKVVRDAKGRLTLETRGVALRDWHNHHVAECPMRWTEEQIQPRHPKPPPPAVTPVVPPPVLIPPPASLDPVGD